jgi:hypothetical protein
MTKAEKRAWEAEKVARRAAEAAAIAKDKAAFEQEWTSMKTAIKAASARVDSRGGTRAEKMAAAERIINRIMNAKR